ncbi:hypothetical protein [Lentzea indica]|uniref:hypothetical protein n=1 Tax=Lentzea indica TaxID=2604800 RepID=UPI001FE37157|nr:hypothetical protein [Lentzea indica]
MTGSAPRVHASRASAHQPGHSLVTAARSTPGGTCTGSDGSRPGTCGSVSTDNAKVSRT